jgi:hypothetical protein
MRDQLDSELVNHLVDVGFPHDPLDAFQLLAVEEHEGAEGGAVADDPDSVSVAFQDVFSLVGFVYHVGSSKQEGPSQRSRRKVWWGRGRKMEFRTNLPNGDCFHPACREGIPQQIKRSGRRRNRPV